MIVHQFTDLIHFSLSLGGEKMFLISYIFWVFNIIQQLVSSSIPLPYAYYQLKGEKNIAQIDQISKCMYFLSRSERKKIQTQRSWQNHLENQTFGLSRFLLSVLLQAPCVRKNTEWRLVILNVAHFATLSEKCGFLCYV